MLHTANSIKNSNFSVSLKADVQRVEDSSAITEETFVATDKSGAYVIFTREEGQTAMRVAHVSCSTLDDVATIADELQAAVMSVSMAAKAIYTWVD